MNEREKKPELKASDNRVKRYDKDALFGEAREIIIRHGELHYRLRETRNGKLILNL
jgi:hemin uptake protein HemP